MADLEIAQAVARADLPAIAAQSTEIKAKGNEYIARCVFHSPDNNPSLYIFQKAGKWQYKCFSCGEGGDALDWIQQVEGLKVKEALPRLGVERPANFKPPKVNRKPDRTTSKPPADAGEPDMYLNALGKPSRTWRYNDSDGALLGFVARYDTQGGKEIRCWTWGARGTEAPRWGCGHWTAPRPLYGLDRLASRYDAPVLIVEGEKAADAAQALLPQYVVITWPGGANARKHVDLSPLKGRRVDLWPDNDEPGIGAMEELQSILEDPAGLACHGKRIVPDGAAEGFDAADWDGTGDELLAWLRARAKDYPEPVPPAEPERKSPDPEPEDMGPDFAPPDGDDPPSDDPEGDEAPVPLSEDAFATHFAKIHGQNWRCVKAWGKWFFFDGEAWAEDRTDSRVQAMREIMRGAQYWPIARELTSSQKRAIFGKQVPIYAALRLAGTDERVRAEPEIWDSDPWMLGIPGGAVDLRSGKQVETAREHHLTMRCSVAPAPGEPKLWLSFLKQCIGDSDVIGFLRRYLGYALTGDNREQCMVFFYGPAQSGKGTILRAVSRILGSADEGGGKFRSYHYEAPISTFLEARSERHSTEIAAFYKKRLITAEEPAAGAKWDESKLKWITGGSQITARFIAQDNFSFAMTGKIIVAANHRPRLSTTDKAIRRRMMVIPFEHPVADEDRDNELDSKLRAEYPQILAWMIQGAIEWQDAGLGLPERISTSTDDYLQDEDTLGAWISENCEFDPSHEQEGRDLYDNYSRWCDAQGETKWSRRAWANALIDRGFRQRVSHSRRLFVGLRAKIGANLP